MPAPAWSASATFVPWRWAARAAGHEAVAGPIRVDNARNGLGGHTVEDALGVHSDGARSAEGADGDLDTLVDAGAQEVFWRVKPVSAGPPT